MPLLFPQSQLGAVVVVALVPVAAGERHPFGGRPGRVGLDPVLQPVGDVEAPEPRLLDESAGRVLVILVQEVVELAVAVKVVGVQNEAAHGPRARAHAEHVLGVLLDLAEGAIPLAILVGPAHGGRSGEVVVQIGPEDHLLVADRIVGLRLANEGLVQPHPANEVRSGVLLSYFCWWKRSVPVRFWTPRVVRR